MSDWQHRTPPLFRVLGVQRGRARPEAPRPRRARGCAQALVAVMVAQVVTGALPAKAAGARGAAKITYVTSTTAFLDAGALDGLTAGASIDVVRRKAKVGTCVIAQLAAHHATCANERAAVGDRVTFALAPQTTAPSVSRPVLPEPAALEAKRLVVEQATVPKIASPRKRHAVTADWSLRGAAGVRQQAWATLGHDDAAFTRTVLDGAVRVGLGLTPGLSAGGALRLVADELQPTVARFRPAEPAELYVWEAALTLDDGRGPFVARVGRFLPRKAPGATVLDGAQAGVRVFGGALELGAYGGAIPDLVTLLPSLDRVTAGVQLALDTPVGADVLVLPRARVALLSTPDFASLRAEAEVQTQLLWGTLLAAGGSVRAGLDARTVTPSLDAARVDLEVRPLDQVRVGAGYRYLAPLSQDFDAHEAVPTVLGAHHGEVIASWSTTPWLSVGARAGITADLEGQEPRGWVGPELRLPALWWGVGGLAVGYSEELGAFPGRNAFLQVDLAPASIVSLWSRAAYLESEGLGEPLREGAVFAGLDAPLLPWLALRARAHALLALPAFGKAPRATPTTLAAEGGAVVSW